MIKGRKFARYLSRSLPSTRLVSIYNFDRMFMNNTNEVTKRVIRRGRGKTLMTLPNKLWADLDFTSLFFVPRFDLKFDWRVFAWLLILFEIYRNTGRPLRQVRHKSRLTSLASIVCFNAIVVNHCIRLKNNPI